MKVCCVRYAKSITDVPAATKEAIDAEGWLDTGDAGLVDEEGFLYIKDRRESFVGPKYLADKIVKDIIIRGGENVGHIPSYDADGY